ncbi:MAG TPA: hypothetical protein VEL51_06795 [Vicinamibacterales bacterium]|nr:hypothetical protein [Vicinamibacterales bacterium]
MDLNLTLTDDERHACRRAALLLHALSNGLQGVGTRQEADACAGYAATLDAIVASGECCAVSADGKVDVEQAAFVLEGIRDGLDNADLDEGADFIARDVERLNDLVFRYNSAAGKAVG